VLDGASSALPKKGFWFRVSQVFTVRVLNEIPADIVCKLDLQQLIDHTRTEMIRELGSMRNAERA